MGFADILYGVGNLADLPGSMVRDVVTFQNPLDQLANPFSHRNRATGRDVLRHYGMAGRQDTPMNAAGGVLAEMAMDPLSWVGVGLAAKGLKGLSAASKATRASRPAMTAAKSAAAKSATAAKPVVAASVASPAVGAYMLADNPEQSRWKNAVGTGLMAAPIAFGMAKGVKGLAKAVKQQPERQGTFYSRLQQAIDKAPEEFRSQPEIVRERKIPGRIITHPKTGKVIKQIPEQVKRDVVPAKAASQNLAEYLKGKAHPQEIEWVLGEQFKDADVIQKSALRQAMEGGKINLETKRHGGAEKLMPSGEYRAEVDNIFYHPTANPDAPKKISAFGPDIEHAEAALYRKLPEQYIDQFEDPRVSPVMEVRPEHGDLKHDMLIPGGKNTTEVPIRLGAGRTARQIFEEVHRTDPNNMSRLKQLDAELEIAEMGGVRFEDDLNHYGDNVLAWVIHDQRKMPDGKNATFIQEIQSDWHQQGATSGYGTPKVDTEIAALEEALLKSVPESKRQSTQYALRSLAVRTSIDAKDVENAARGLGVNEETLIDYLTKHVERIDREYTGALGVPDAPFKGNEWTKLAIKQAIDDAIQRGDDYVLWANGRQVSETQGMPINAAKQLYEVKTKNIVNAMLKPYGAKAEWMELPGIKNERRLLPWKYIDDDTWYARDAGGWAAEVNKEGNDYWAFYQGMSGSPRKFPSPELAQKYIEDQKGLLRGEAEVLGFKIPEGMKQTAKQHGFPMMSLLPIGAAGGGALVRATMGGRQEQANTQ